ncbi:hypothetical protein ACIBQ3_32365 [Streptomyces rubiginosohelvolus]|uniref:hypothetical protein n=1 Tax=Streptomyces rubiginosohelvolus TaxID=67362 RepID=UPI003789AE79
MPSSDQPSNERPRQHKITWPRALVAVTLSGALVAGIVLANRYGDDVAKAILHGNAVTQSLIIGGVLATGLLVGRSAPNNASPEEDESRQRLTRAEDALAEAIRREYTMPTGTTFGGSLTHSSDRTAWQLPEEEDQEPDPPSAGEAGRRGTLGLPELWEATHARLDLYHQIATGQAKTSFRNAQIAMGAGFLLLILFACIALWASTTAVAIVAGGLGAVSAALAGYVAKTFIRSQEAAATHLRSYFDQPLELSRYLAAERLVADGDLTQEQRGEILSALVQAMVAGPQPPAAPQAVTVVPVPGQAGA